jgi:hypothetical protein
MKTVYYAQWDVVGYYGEGKKKTRHCISQSTGHLPTLDDVRKNIEMIEGYLVKNDIRKVENVKFYSVTELPDSVQKAPSPSDPLPLLLPDLISKNRYKTILSLKLENLSNRSDDYLCLLIKDIGKILLTWENNAVYRNSTNEEHDKVLTQLNQIRRKAYDVVLEVKA